MATFQETFQKAPSVHTHAHGRVNLIGEHTDYNHGFVLPTLIPQKTTIAFALSHSDKVGVATSVLRNEIATTSYRLGEEEQKHGWTDYVQGVTWMLRQRGYLLKPFQALIDSEVPMGAGLSSSAALLVALFRGLRALFDLPLDDVNIALMSQTVENEFVGAKVGIMDQMAASLAQEGQCLFIDTQDLSYRRLPLPGEAMEFFVINSGIKHRHADGGYNKRRQECEEACQRLGVTSLRDLSPGNTAINALPDVLAKRVRHVLGENQRVLDAMTAIAHTDLEGLGRLFCSSHESMRDLYEVSIPEIDLLVSEAVKQEGVAGARLTGGGFGGSIVGVCKPGRADTVSRKLQGLYKEKTGHVASVLVPVSKTQR